LDPVAAARWQSLPQHEAHSPWLHEEVATRMQERLDIIKLKPQQWVHWGPLRGGLAAQRALEQRYPQAQVWLAAEAPAHALATRKALRSAWWQPQRWRHPQRHEGLPPDHTADMLWANMHLHACAEPLAMLQSWHRALAVDGFLMFSCLGPDTLRGVRQLYAQAGWPEPAHAFTDMHDWGDMLVEAGFAEPVMDMERITLTYGGPDALLKELRGLGRNLHVQRFQGLRSRQWRARLSDALLALARAEEGGRLSLDFEIIYGHALKPRPRMRMAAKTEIGLDQMRWMLHSGGGIQDKV
jgi:malonyl-CoA O-methyltransferase